MAVLSNRTFYSFISHCEVYHLQMNSECFKCEKCNWEGNFVSLFFFRSTFKQIHIVRYYEVKLYAYGNIKELSNLLFDNPLTEFKHTYYYFADTKQNFRKMKSLVYSQVLFSISVNCRIYVYNLIDYTSYIYI